MSEAPKTPSLRVLVLEDDPADSLLLTGMLGRVIDWDISVSQAVLLDEAIDQIKQHPPDLCLADLNLPDAAGLETVQRLREANSYMPLIVISGVEDRAISRDAVRAGAQDYVIKDELNTHVLLKTIDQALARAALEQELRESRRKTMENALLQQNEAIRAEIGGELHDVLSQNLTAMTFLLKRLHRQVRPEHLEKPELLDNLGSLLNQAILDVERMSHGLYPPELERRGLAQALEELTLYTGSLHEVPCAFHGEDVAFGAEGALHIYRIAQESISNAIKHGSPTQITVTLSQEGHVLILDVHDNGDGFNPAKTSSGLGRLTMQHRTDALGGRLQISSDGTTGTRVVCRVPSTLPE